MTKGRVRGNGAWNRHPSESIDVDLVGMILRKRMEQCNRGRCNNDCGYMQCPMQCLCMCTCSCNCNYSCPYFKPLECRNSAFNCKPCCEYPMRRMYSCDSLNSLYSMPNWSNDIPSNTHMHLCNNGRENCMLNPQMSFFCEHANCGDHTYDCNACNSNLCNRLSKLAFKNKKDFNSIRDSDLVVMTTNNKYRGNKLRKKSSGVTSRNPIRKKKYKLQQKNSGFRLVNIPKFDIISMVKDKKRKAAEAKLAENMSTSLEDYKETEIPNFDLDSMPKKKTSRGKGRGKKFMKPNHCQSIVDNIETSDRIPKVDSPTIVKQKRKKLQERKRVKVNQSLIDLLPKKSQMIDGEFEKKTELVKEKKKRPAKKRGPKKNNSGMSDINEIISEPINMKMMQNDNIGKTNKKTKNATSNKTKRGTTKASPKNKNKGNVKKRAAKKRQKSPQKKSKKYLESSSNSSMCSLKNALNAQGLMQQDYSSIIKESRRALNKDMPNTMTPSIHSPIGSMMGSSNSKKRSGVFTRMERKRNKANSMQRLNNEEKLPETMSGKFETDENIQLGRAVKSVDTLKASNKNREARLLAEPYKATAQLKRAGLIKKRSVANPTPLQELQEVQAQLREDSSRYNKP